MSDVNPLTEHDNLIVPANEVYLTERQIQWFKEWSKRLRSGKYNQSFNEALRDNDGYCCLGVLCTVHPEVIWRLDACAFLFNRQRQEGDLSVDLAESLGFSEYKYSKQSNDFDCVLATEKFVEDLRVGVRRRLNQSYFINMNDNLWWTFEEIADIVDVIVAIAEKSDAP